MSELDRNTSWRMWLIAAVCAVTLHVGGIAAAVYEMQQEEDADGLGANAIEVGMEMVSPDVEQTDLPPGPNSQASAAAPAVQEQKAVEKESDLPQAKPQESEEPDLAVTENKAKKPEDETPEKSQKQQEASQESVASEDLAEQKFEDAKPADKSAATEAGKAADKKKLSAQWTKQLSAHLEQHKKYPKGRQQQAAEVTVNFEINRVGKVLSVRVVKGSGDSAFDEEALAMVRRSDPLPSPPALIADDGLSFTVPVIFRVKKG